MMTTEQALLLVTIEMLRQDKDFTQVEMEDILRVANQLKTETNDRIRYERAWMEGIR